jgi:benzoate membrane transport protein
VRASVVLSALVAVVVGFGGTVALIITAAEALGASAAQTSSWVTAICLGTAATTAVLSIRHRLPIMTAWSTPGAALIAATAGTVSMEAAVGAFILAGALILLTAMIRPIGTLIEKIPTPLAAAMLAGVLIRFVTAIFEQAAIEPALVLPLLALFLIARLVSPSGAVIVALVAGLALAFGLGLGEGGTFVPELSALVFVAPEFEPAVLIGVGLPLYLVTMAGQNLPGFAVLRASGYTPPSRSILATTGIASIAMAFFGSHTANLSAITASICTGPDAHPDPAKRWLCGLSYAAGYRVIAALGPVRHVDGAMPAAPDRHHRRLRCSGAGQCAGAALAPADERLPRR